MARGRFTYNPGALPLSAAVSGGRGSYDIDRPDRLPWFLGALAKGDTPDIDNVDGAFPACSLSFDFGGWYLKPLWSISTPQRLGSLTAPTSVGLAGREPSWSRATTRPTSALSPALELGNPDLPRPTAPLIRPYAQRRAPPFDETDHAYGKLRRNTKGGSALPHRELASDDVAADKPSAGVAVRRSPRHPRSS